MSKYTELLSEYLENNELPTIFDEIAGFKEQFTMYFLDREIGFETEDLFKFKLENYANFLIPLYKVRLQQLTQAITNANNPIKVFYDKYTTTFNLGETKASITNLPFDSQVAQPKVINESTPTINTETKEQNHEEKGTTTLEAYELLDKLNTSVYSVILELLERFDICFMQTY